MEQKKFREPPRYMVGDIVYSHGFICIVCSVYPFNIDYSYDLKVIDGQSLGKICQNDIMHVHIWEEFLKKNGWTYHRSDGECLCYTMVLYLQLGIMSRIAMILAMKRETIIIRAFQVFQEWTHTISSLQSQICQRIG